MVTEVTKKPQLSNSTSKPPPPRKINVQKFAQSRALELQSLQHIVENRLNNDYKSKRNKRRRTTAFDNQVAKKGSRRRKKQKLGTVDNNAESVLEKKKVSRRLRRRYEFKSNPEIGFCTSGDGTKRLRTHVWHAKRFTMTKLWGYHLPLGLQGKGKGSRALLNRQGPTVHDASYYTAVQLEGPEDSLVSVLRMVLVPSPTTDTNPGNSNDPVLSGTTYGIAMLHQVGAPVSQPIAPITYMWRPSPQQNITDLNVREEHDIRDESINHGVDLCGKSDERGSSHRYLWVWIHASAFEEGYGNLKLACQKEMEKMGISINCSSLEGQLAKLELMGPGAFQLLQKILRPAKCISENSENRWQLKSHVTIGEDLVSQNKKSFILKNEEHFSSFAMVSLNVNDPRDVPMKRGVVPTEPIPTKAPSDAQETICKELADPENNTDLSSLSWSEFLDKHSDTINFNLSQSSLDNLWCTTTRGLRPPVEDNVLCKEKHRERVAKFCLDDIDFGEPNSSSKVQSSRSCPIFLLKIDDKEVAIGWSVILPLSWVKAFWIPLVSNGALAIGLREKHWIACEMGRPLFPSDFPDCKAYSCFMAAKAAEYNQKAELRPPSVRILRVPMLPPWGIVRISFSKVIGAMDNLDFSAREDSSSNSGSGNLKISNSDFENSFDGTIVRTGGMLTTFLNETKCGQLLLFPQGAEGKARLSNLINGELNHDPRHISSVIDDHKLCFLRVHLKPFKEGFFEEGAVICAPCISDIYLWTSSSEKSDVGLKMSDSAMRSYFKENSSGKWGMQIPDDSIDGESHRWPIGFVTKACVQGSKELIAAGFCETVLLSHLRHEQWKELPINQRKPDIYVLVRNLRSVAYRLALASVILEYQENDIRFL